MGSWATHGTRRATDVADNQAIKRHCPDTLQHLKLLAVNLSVAASTSSGLPIVNHQSVLVAEVFGKARLVFNTRMLPRITTASFVGTLQSF